ncbi:MAG: hypothetical protein HQL36_12715, partial [Alphaproteobacteria bacterium]|nr:hypothetical protein [Alphaproteobacteria bacterium]
MKRRVGTALCVGVTLGLALTAIPAMAVDSVGERLDREFARAFAARGGEAYAHLPLDLSRKLYLEGVDLIQPGVNFFGGCKTLAKDKHELLPGERSPFLVHKGVTIVGSPYHSTPVRTGKDNNPLYFRRLAEALDVIER